MWLPANHNLYVLLSVNTLAFLTYIVSTSPPHTLTMETAESASECVATSIRRVVLLDWENFPRLITGATESADSGDSKAQRL